MHGHHKVGGYKVIYQVYQPDVKDRSGEYFALHLYMADEPLTLVELRYEDMALFLRNTHALDLFESAQKTWQKKTARKMNLRMESLSFRRRMAVELFLLRRISLLEPGAVPRPLVEGGHDQR